RHRAACAAGIFGPRRGPGPPRRPRVPERPGGRRPPVLRALYLVGMGVGEANLELVQQPQLRLGLILVTLNPSASEQRLREEVSGRVFLGELLEAAQRKLRLPSPEVEVCGIEESVVRESVVREISG